MSKNSWFLIDYGLMLLKFKELGESWFAQMFI